MIDLTNFTQDRGQKSSNYEESEHPVRECFGFELDVSPCLSVHVVYYLFVRLRLSSCTFPF